MFTKWSFVPGALSALLYVPASHRVSYLHRWRQLTCVPPFFMMQTMVSGVISLEVDHKRGVAVVRGRPEAVEEGRKEFQDKLASLFPGDFLSVGDVRAYTQWPNTFYPKNAVLYGDPIQACTRETPSGHACMHVVLDEKRAKEV